MLHPTEDAVVVADNGAPREARGLYVNCRDTSLFRERREDIYRQSSCAPGRDEKIRLLFPEKCLEHAEEILHHPLYLVMRVCGSIGIKNVRAGAQHNPFVAQDMRPEEGGSVFRLKRGEQLIIQRFFFILSEEFLFDHNVRVGDIVSFEKVFCDDGELDQGAERIYSIVVMQMRGDFVEQSPRFSCDNEEAFHLVLWG